MCTLSAATYHLQCPQTQPRTGVAKAVKTHHYNETSQTIEHYKTTHEFEECAKDECHLCLLLFNQISADTLDLLWHCRITCRR